MQPFGLVKGNIDRSSCLEAQNITLEHLCEAG